MVNGRMYLSEDAMRYKEHVGLLCNTAGFEPLDGNISLTLCFYRPAKRGDLDNRIKILVDALQGHIYHNDSQVAEIHAYRYDDKTSPRVEVYITPVGADE
jgi:Holliday junction resolvase RusA-like endonuclease